MKYAIIYQSEHNQETDYTLRLCRSFNDINVAFNHLIEYKDFSNSWYEQVHYLVVEVEEKLNDGP